MSSALASPIGYRSLNYITYPMMVLTKSSKPIPVMLIGVLYYQRNYPWYKYVSVFMLIGGISLFTFYKDSSSSQTTSDDVNKDSLTIAIGVMLVLANLSLDGYTNNEQDHIFNKYSASSIQMMKYVNFWQGVYLATYLIVIFFIYGEESELKRALTLMTATNGLVNDVGLFCLFAAIGQILLFELVKEFGSLLWVTVSVTRKLFTVIASVILFNHSVNSIQWAGVALVFSGMFLEIYMNYSCKKKKD